MKVLILVIAVGLYFGAFKVLMYCNMTYLDLGDLKAGQDGWTVYWWGWALMYLPPLFFGVTLNWIKNEKLKDFIKCNSVLTLVLCVFAEISYVFSILYDISWQYLLIEYLALGVLWCYVLKLKKFLTKRFG